jgi:hypothetical protein
VRGGSRDDLFDLMQQESWHVFHFIGHGGTERYVDSDGQSRSRGFVVMQDGYGAADKVSGSELGLMLEGSGSLRLAVLNCCDSGRGSSGFSNVGTALVTSGVPMAVAMQFAISNGAAVRFASMFYKSLVLGETVERALTVARRYMRNESNVEWGIPVLFTRSGSCVLFEIQSREAPAELTGKWPQCLPQRLPRYLCAKCRLAKNSAAYSSKGADCISAQKEGPPWTRLGLAPARSLRCSHGSASIDRAGHAPIPPLRAIQFGFFATRDQLYLLLLVVVYAVLRWGFAVYARVDASTTEQPPGALIWIAAALTLCVQAVPALSAHLRAWLQRMAGIPGHAQRLATLLADAEFEATASDREIARRMLLSRGVDGECDEFPLAQPAHRLLFKAAELFVQLRHWEDEPRFSRFVFEARNDFDLLRRRFDRLSFRVSRASR